MVMTGAVNNRLEEHETGRRNGCRTCLPDRCATVGAHHLHTTQPHTHEYISAYTHAQHKLQHILKCALTPRLDDIRHNNKTMLWCMPAGPKQVEDHRSTLICGMCAARAFAHTNGVPRRERHT